MAGYQDLSEFERGVIVGAREMGHGLSEVAMKFGFSRATIYECTVNIGNPVKHQIYDIAATGKRIMQERDQQRLTRIIKHDRRTTHPQIAADFIVGPSTSVTV
ncbi:HTH_Tnp_Tc3_2 domain-containing protein [Trichonephila clavipes]|nr:HTH_Tnp_Tc3_2 domain-containing protein [Trichonephila clavipes]